jgi:hypothetical protein
MTSDLLFMHWPQHLHQIVFDIPVSFSVGFSVKTTFGAAATSQYSCSDVVNVIFRSLFKAAKVHFD